MSTSFQRGIFLAVTGTFLFAAFTVSASTWPFVGSIKTEHATLYLNVDHRARQIWPVEIRTVDGVLSNRSNQGMLWIRPGAYIFTMRVSEAVNLAEVPGLARSTGYGNVEHALKLQVQTGKAYYIGAKFQASGVWEPVVWKIRDIGTE